MVSIMQRSLEINVSISEAYSYPQLGGGGGSVSISAHERNETKRLRQISSDRQHEFGSCEVSAIILFSSGKLGLLLVGEYEVLDVFFYYAQTLRGEPERYGFQGHSQV